MVQYLHIIQAEVPFVSKKDLFAPIKETQIDSLDNVVIRVSLEKHFGIEISDSLWYKYETLAEALEYFHANGRKPQTKSSPQGKEIRVSNKVEIRMPEMANSALSESWLLKYLGDTHWNLLSKGFKAKASFFFGEDGQRVYATFVRINYSVSPLDKFQENEYIRFHSSINGFGENTYLSTVIGKDGLNTINATLMTTFTKIVNSDSNFIKKAQPGLDLNNFKQLKNTPGFLNEYRLLKKGLMNEVPSHYGAFPINDDSIFSCEYVINPYCDINGVGLLYFAAYPIISDRCSLEHYTFEKYHSYHTVYRDIFYFSNCNPNEKIRFEINDSNSNDNQLNTVSSLYRVSDNTLLAKILTVKQK